MKTILETSTHTIKVVSSSFTTDEQKAYDETQWQETNLPFVIIDSSLITHHVPYVTADSARKNDGDKRDYYNMIGKYHEFVSGWM